MISSMRKGQADWTRLESRPQGSQELPACRSGRGFGASKTTSHIVALGLGRLHDWLMARGRLDLTICRCRQRYFTS
jgi:hypothetical protein